MNPRIVIVLSVLSFLSPISVLAAENDTANCLKFVRHQAELKQLKSEPATIVPPSRKVPGQTQTSSSAG